jgi:protein phosphatase 1 regulatory subunit 11
MLPSGSEEGRQFLGHNYTLNINGGSLGGGRGSERSRTSSATTTMTITQNNEASTPGEGGTAGEQEEDIILRLDSDPRVTWEEGVVNNEGLGRKSSKRCCIFSKRRAWDESSTESDSDGGQGAGSARPIARPKTKKDVPDFQRFHA